MSVNISFSSSNPLNSVVTDARTGHVLFELSTPFTFGKRTTTMFDSRREIVAMYKRRLWSHDQVMYHGETRRLSEWMPKTGWSGNRRIHAPNGRLYVWKKRWGSSSFKLVDRHTKQTVAKTHYARYGLFGSSRRVNIEVRPEAAAILDAIVFSFAICEQQRRSNATNAAIAASA